MELGGEEWAGGLREAALDVGGIVDGYEVQRKQNHRSGA